MTDIQGLAKSQLKSFIERIERLLEEKQSIADDVKDVYAELAGQGFDAKIVRKVIAIRKKDANERAEEEALISMYCAALGMQGDLFEQAA